MTYPEAKVVGLINANFVPLKVHVDESPELVKRFRVPLPSTIIMADSEGTEHHRTTGFLPPEEYQAQLDFGIAKTAFNEEDFVKASKQFNQVVSQYPKSDIAPEAQFWLAVSEYKRTKSTDALLSGWKKLLEDYPDSPWAKRVSFIKEK